MKQLLAATAGAALIFAACGGTSSPTSSVSAATEAPVTASTVVDSTTTVPTTTAADPEPPPEIPSDDCTYTQPEEPEASVGQQVVVAWFQCGGWNGDPDVSNMVFRVMPGNMSPFEASLRALLAGPTAEEVSAGMGSFFTDETVDALNYVTLDGDQAFVDFNDSIIVNNASTSTGGLFFMAELRTAVFYQEVNSVVWSIDGSCEAFGEWLQVGECMIDTRTDWELRLLAWSGS